MSASRQNRNAGSTDTDLGFKVHPTSKWEEPARYDDLTLWEVNRPPRKLVTKNRRIRCPLKMLNSQFRCVICLGYLKETTVVSVCGHRFCFSCINKCIRIGMKECPSCRKFIPSRRSLKRDTNFDLIVKNMIGNPLDRQLNEDSIGRLDANKMVHLQRAITKKRLIVERQKQKQEPKNSPAGAPTARTLTSSLPTLDDSLQDQSPLIDLELRRHPQEEKVDRLDKPFLTVPGEVKVSLLKDFLSRKLTDREYEITCTLDDNSVVLDDDLGLADAKETLCPSRDDTMVLMYREQTQDTPNPNGEASNSARHKEG